MPPRDLVYHLKVRLKEFFKIRIQNQVLWLGETRLENGRRLQHYFKSGQLSAVGSNTLRLEYTGPSRLAEAHLVQLFVRTLTGYAPLDDRRRCRWTAS